MSEDGRDPPDGLYVTTRGESDARAARLLPTTPSEDVSSLLTVPPDIADTVGDVDEDEEAFQLPEPAIEWIVTINLASHFLLHRNEVLEVFDADWREAHGHPTFYGFDADNGQWLYIHASEAPPKYTRLQLTWRLVPFDVKQTISADIIRGWLAAVHSRVAGRGEVVVTVDPESAARRAVELRDVVQRCDQHVEIFVCAPPGQQFDGKVIWDVMLCLGLRWGDMDLFHWMNPSPVGDAALFSVCSTTEPGYFLPEDVAANRCKVEDVAFTFSIARSAAPREVFDSMLRAAHYTATRLGGTVQDAVGPLGTDQMRAWIGEVVSMLQQAGFPPGAPATLLLI